MWCVALLSTLVAALSSAKLTSYVADQLHLNDIDRYEACPFHSIHFSSFACHLEDPEKTERIIRTTDVPFLHGRAVFPLLRKQTILMTGDSLVRNQFTSFACLLWEADRSISSEHIIWEGNTKYFKITSPTFDFEVQFIFTGNILNIHEKKLPELYEPKGARIGLYPPIEEVIRGNTSLRQPTILLLSAGHHFDMGKYSPAPPPPAKQPVIDLTLYRLAMRRINELLKHHLAVDWPAMRVIWRAIPPRHFIHGEWNTGGRCDRASPCPEAFIHQEMGKIESHYWKSQILSNIVRNNSAIYSFEYLDILPISLNRCDAMVGVTPVGNHGNISDCSHYCVPGAPDAWNAALVDMLLG